MSQSVSKHQRLRILIVEDHDLLRKLFFEAFREKHIIHMASTAEEGWKLYLDKTPHIIFLDIGLPGVSGHSLAHRIKERDATSYIVMVSSSDFAVDIDKAKQNDVDGYIIKPFDKTKITSSIDRYLAADNVKPDMAC